MNLNGNKLVTISQLKFVLRMNVCFILISFCTYRGFLGAHLSSTMAFEKKDFTVFTTHEII